MPRHAALRTANQRRRSQRLICGIRLLDRRIGPPTALFTTLSYVVSGFSRTCRVVRLKADPTHRELVADFELGVDDEAIVNRMELEGSDVRKP